MLLPPGLASLEFRRAELGNLVSFGTTELGVLPQTEINCAYYFENLPASPGPNR